MKRTKLSRGRYQIEYQGHVWEVRKDFVSKRWFGECFTYPGKMIDSTTLSVAEYDLANGYLVDCASAGLM